MAGWDEILAKMDATGNSCDSVRRGYLKKLHNVTHRNIIAYYSAFLQKPTASNISISDSDMTGFMNAIKGLDCNKGLDFILHTPGGDPTAAESIVNYLRGKFKNDIRVIVPHLALSAGTMVACSAKEIVMGNHSNLGPIDPQISGIPAYDIVFLFLQAKAEIESNPSSVAYWKLLLEKYPSTSIYIAQSYINLSSELVTKWLETCMFLDDPQKQEKAKMIADKLNEHTESKSHSRHLNAEFAKKIGLKIIDLESDQSLQDAVLSVHHSYMLTLERTNSLKIIENHLGKAVVSRGPQ